jgi:hypothetical protein
MDRGQLLFIEMASQLYITQVSVSMTIFQAEFSSLSLVFALILW